MTHQTDHRIGCWVLNDTKLVRSCAGEVLHFWADLQEVDLLTAEERIILVGESTARGYLYDPEFTPAEALARVIGRAANRRVQVIDLAQTNASMQDTLLLLRAAAVLRPRVIVLWAGNNWFPMEDLASTEAPGVVAEIRAGANALRLRTYLEELHRQRVRALIAEVTAIVHSIGAKGIVVIPEFNLLGWRDALPEAPPIARERRSRWAAARKRLLAAHAAGNWIGVEAHADELMHLDGGLGSLGCVAKAELCLRQDEACARALLEAARDAELWPKSPRCHGATGLELRGRAVDQGLTVVDLPRGLAESSTSSLPSRDLFLDYCHHSYDGLRVACALIAEAVLERSFGVSASWHDLTAVMPGIPPRVEARAQFLAAAHNAAHGQPTETIRYHLDKAIEVDPGAETEICQHRRHRLGHAPQVLAGGNVWSRQAERYFGPSGLRRGPLEVSLIEQIALRIRDAEEVHELIAGHRLTSKPVDLLCPWYGQLVAMDEATLEGCAYHRRRRSTSSFVVALAEPASVRLDISYRTPHGRTDSFVKVNSAGRVITRLPASAVWRRARVTIPASAVSAGMNVFQIEWPDSTLDGREILAEYADALEAGERPVAPYPVLGEVFTLRANL